MQVQPRERTALTTLGALSTLYVYQFRLLKSTGTSLLTPGSCIVTP